MNTRACPFDGCRKMVSPEFFSCRAHWHGLDAALKSTVWEMWGAYQRGEIGIEELRRRQQEVLDLAQGVRG